MRELGLSDQEASRRSGGSVSVVANLKKAAKRGDESGITLRTVKGLATALGVTAEWLISGEAEEMAGASPELGIRMVPLVGEVKAGAFMSVQEMEEPDEFLGFYDPQYARADLFALRVVGRSMNLRYPDGSIVICVNSKESGIIDGDDVVLKRFNGLGQVETTIKEYVINGESQEFWPRSTDPKHRLPFIAPPPNSQTDEEWEVVGVVIAEQRKRRRGRDGAGR